MIFVNMPVQKLSRSVEFFTKLGFKFNPQFTDETSTCMIVSEHIYVMLLEHERFASFVKKPIAGPDTVEAIFSFACESREQVKEISERAFELGARKVDDPSDLGFMYSWGFEDLDGHLWDLFWMDPAHVQ